MKTYNSKRAYIQKQWHSRQDKPKLTLRYVFLLIPGLPALSLAAAVEPLLCANRLLGYEAYSWVFASLDAQQVRLTQGISVDTVDPTIAADGADYFFVCSRTDLPHRARGRYLAVLRSIARQGIGLGALTNGSFLLAHTGLLNGYRCTLHWESFHQFRDEFPLLECTRNLFEIDRNRATCGGGVAATDMMLALIAERHDPSISLRIANRLNHFTIRDTYNLQRVGGQVSSPALPEIIKATMALMDRTIDAPLSITAIADSVGVSTRQLERLMRQHLHMSPAQYYTDIRLEKARDLLTNSKKSVTSVALDVGFTSSSHFSSRYKEIYGLSPSETKRIGEKEREEIEMMRGSQKLT